MKDIKEFESNFTYDSQDLTTLGSGSGIHKKRDVEVTFNIRDRNGDILFNKENTSFILESHFLKSCLTSPPNLSRSLSSLSMFELKLLSIIFSATN